MSIEAQWEELAQQERALAEKEQRLEVNLQCLREYKRDLKYMLSLKEDMLTENNTLDNKEVELRRQMEQIDALPIKEAEGNPPLSRIMYERMTSVMSDFLYKEEAKHITSFETDTQAYLKIECGSILLMEQYVDKSLLK